MSSDKVNQNEIDDLVNKDIIELLDLKNLDEKKQNELREKILETVQSRVFTRIIQDIESLGKLSEYDQINDDNAIEKFFIDNNINLEEYFVEEVFLIKSQLKTSADLIDYGLIVKAGK
jgi:hypothetical protein